MNAVQPGSVPAVTKPHLAIHHAGVAESYLGIGLHSTILIDYR